MSCHAQIVTAVCTYMHALGVAELLHSLHGIYEVVVGIHLMRPELVHVHEPVEISELKSREVSATYRRAWSGWTLTSWPFPLGLNPFACFASAGNPLGPQSLPSSSFGRFGFFFGASSLLSLSLPSLAFPFAPDFSGPRSRGGELLGKI